MVKRIAVFTDNADPLAALGGIESGGENVYVNELCRALSRYSYKLECGALCGNFPEAESSVPVKAYPELFF